MVVVVRVLHKVVSSSLTIRPVAATDGVAIKFSRCNINSEVRRIVSFQIHARPVVRSYRWVCRPWECSPALPLPLSRLIDPDPVLFSLFLSSSLALFDSPRYLEPPARLGHQRHSSFSVLAPRAPRPPSLSLRLRRSFHDFAAARRREDSSAQSLRRSLTSFPRVFFSPLFLHFFFLLFFQYGESSLFLLDTRKRQNNKNKRKKKKK